MMPWLGSVTCAVGALVCLTIASQLAKRSGALQAPLLRRPVPWEVILNPDPDCRAALRERRRRLGLWTLSVVWMVLVGMATARVPVGPVAALAHLAPDWVWLVIAIAPAGVAEWYFNDFRCPRCGQRYGRGRCAQCGLHLREASRTQERGPL